MSRRWLSEGSRGGGTTTSRLTRSKCPLYTHRSSVPLLACLTFFLDGLVGSLSFKMDSLRLTGLTTSLSIGGKSASLLLLVRCNADRPGPKVSLPPRDNSQIAASSASSPLSALTIQRRQSEKSRNSLSFSLDPSKCNNEARFRNVRPGVMSRKGRLAVLRCRARRDMVCAWV